MSKAEILVTTMGEMRDMIACQAVINGAAEQVKHYSLQDILLM